MDEKEKNKHKLDSKFPLWRFFATLAFALLILPMLVGVLCTAYIILGTVYDSIQIRQCFNEGEVLEWNGLIEFASPETLATISQENLSRLSLLPYTDNTVFPEIEYNTAISHPQHSYFLSSNWSEFGLYPPNYLVLCQPNGWASHVLSSHAHNYRFSPDGSLFAVVSDRNNIEIYDANTIELIRAHEFSELNYIGYFAFHPTEPLIAFITLDPYVHIGRLYIWNYETQEELAIIDYGGFNWVDFLAFNTEGKFLIMRITGRETATLVWGIPRE